MINNTEQQEYLSKTKEEKKKGKIIEKIKRQKPWPPPTKDRKSDSKEDKKERS